MSDSQQKRLRLMTFWIFGSVMIMWTALYAYYGMWLVMGAGYSWLGVFGVIWPAMLIIAVAGGVIWAVYRFWYLPQAKD